MDASNHKPRKIDCVTPRLSKLFLKQLLAKFDKQDVALLKTRLLKIQYSKFFPKRVHKLSKPTTE